MRNYPGVSERSKLNPLAKRTGGWRFFSMDSLSFLFLLGTKYLCFRPGARIQRPTSCITGSPLQPTEYLNMWRLPHLVAPQRRPVQHGGIQRRTSEVCGYAPVGWSPYESGFDEKLLYGFCPDLDQNEDGSIGSLADALWQSTVWYFWWD